MIYLLLAVSLLGSIEECIFSDGFECPPIPPPLSLVVETLDIHPDLQYARLTWDIQDYVIHPCVMNRISSEEKFKILDTVQLDNLSEFVDILPTSDTRFELDCVTEFFEGERKIGSRGIGFTVTPLADN